MFASIVATLRRSVLPGLAGSLVAVALGTSLLTPSTLDVPTRVPTVAAAVPVPAARFLKPDGTLHMYVVDERGVRYGDRWLHRFEGGVSKVEDRRGILLEALYESAAEQRGWRGCEPIEGLFDGPILVAVDPVVPSTTLRDVLSTLHHADYDEVYFLVSGPTVDVPRRPFEPDTWGQATLLAGEPLPVHPRSDSRASPQRHRLADLDVYGSKTAAECTRLAVGDGVPMADIATAMSRLHATGNPEIRVEIGGKPQRPRALAWSDTTRRVSIGAVLPVLRTTTRCGPTLRI